MVRAVRSKTEGNSTEALCDGRKAVCPGSRVKGIRGDRPANEATALAHKQGWVDRMERDENPRRRRWATVVKLLCPGCQGKDQGQGE